MSGGKDKKTVRSIRREVQQGVKCWECEEEEHYLWACPKKVVHPKKGEAQHKEVRRTEEEKVLRKWHKRERAVERMGQLWKRGEQGWIEQRGRRWYVVSVVTCRYCGENGVKEEDNFMQEKCVHDM